MEFRSKLPGILLIAAGIGLGVVNLFVPGLILVLIGIFSGITAQPRQKTQPVRPERRKVEIARDTTGAPAADAYAFRGSVNDYFLQILQNCFPGCTVMENPSSRTSRTGWTAWLLYRDGAPKAAVFLADKYSWDAADISDAMKDCSRRGIPCLRFIRQFRNDAGYVIGRINGILR